MEQAPEDLFFRGFLAAFMPVQFDADLSNSLLERRQLCFELKAEKGNEYLSTFYSNYYFHCVYFLKPCLICMHAYDKIERRIVRSYPQWSLEL